MHLKRDISLLGDVFKNFRKMCLAIHQLDPAKFLSSTRLAWKEALEKTELKLQLLASIDILLMVKKGFNGGICHSINIYVKVNNNYMK